MVFPIFLYLVSNTLYVQVVSLLGLLKMSCTGKDQFVSFYLFKCVLSQGGFVLLFLFSGFSLFLLYPRFYYFPKGVTDYVNFQCFDEKSVPFQNNNIKIFSFYYLLMNNQGNCPISLSNNDMRIINNDITVSCSCP